MKTADMWDPSEAMGDMDVDLGRLLTLTPPTHEDKEGKSLDWRTQTLPLLARPELGLTPDVQTQLLQFVHENREDEGHDRRLRWLREQRKRLVTDAIVAAGEAEGHRVEDAENTERVERILEHVEERYTESNEGDCPWNEAIGGIRGEVL